jgi:hypothetical protein
MEGNDFQIGTRLFDGIRHVKFFPDRRIDLTGEARIALGR